ncbi:exonuclease mut-7 homolog [Nilaparvata lugens]|uniref:exonuclease mut-7 homolog n=1 Tax=Nilaparvata lugens TaxID=108931 RepID=UPI00193DC6D3|nr:exonuclease mut-7 homolog [Nilaparvata lugens]XP_039287136.1 exonuclease mut-7 homolog [Nilaparvata lugens]XP_039287137.1 exonuclease mut-7 homolog [Nilaparvata lugens]XP_039287138.1 exonuclease mut-7 homolog [Nilaparvata lugens]
MAGNYVVPAPRLLSHSNYLQHDHSLDPWVSKIQAMFDSWKKSNHLSSLLFQFFESSQNPYYSALYLMAFSPDLKLAKPTTLAFIAIEEFSRWLNVSHGRPDPQLLNPHLKRFAFVHVTSQKNLALIKLVFKLYKLIDNKDDFVPDIKDMLRKKMYKEASQVVMLLELQDNFAVEDFLVPLVFQDVIGIVEDYMDATPNVRTALIGYLDGIVVSDNPSNDRTTIIHNLDIPDVKYEKLHYKPLSKFMVRLMKKYNLPSTCCPNLTNKKSRGALQFIITRKYRDKSIGNESWREMILETVGNDKELHIELIQSLCTVDDLKEAMHWAQYFSIPFEELPDYLKRSIDEKNGKLLDGSDESNQNVEEEDWEKDTLVSTQHYELPLSSDNIVMIDTLEKLEQLSEFGLSDDLTTVGLDAEWKPAFSHNPSVLSLLQIATKDRVFLIDILSIDKSSSVWHRFGSALFANQNILKLGFSFESDIHMLKENIKVFENLKMTGLGFLDLASLWNTLTKDWSINLPYAVPTSSTKNAASLSHLVHLCCGYPLDKADQFSNWEKRPLRDSQKKYAASDAYCLLLVYDTLKECSLRQKIPFDDVCDELMTKVTVKKTVNKKKTKHHVEKQMPPKPNSEPVGVGWMYAMCVSHLEGLGKKLRMLGIDTDIIPPGQIYEESLHLARSENRIVLASGSLFNRFFNDLPPTFCYKVNDRVSTEDQVTEVLEYYNIAVKETDIFSRCMVCNCNEFARVESHTMKEMIVEATRQATAQPHYEAVTSPEPPRFHVDDLCSSYDVDYEEEEEEDDFQPGPPVHKMHHYQPKPGEIVQLGSCKTTKGADIQLAEIPVGVLDKVSLFNICENCGKCYWDGSHLSRVLQSSNHRFIANIV